jgi:hypothetical protein
MSFKTAISSIASANNFFSFPFSSSKRLQPLRVRHFEPAELGFPFVKRRFRNSVLAAHISRRRPRLLLPQDPYDCSSLNRLPFIVRLLSVTDSIYISLRLAPAPYHADQIWCFRNPRGPHSRPSEQCGLRRSASFVQRALAFVSTTCATFAWAPNGVCAAIVVSCANFAHALVEPPAMHADAPTATIGAGGEPRWAQAARRTRSA